MQPTRGAGRSAVSKRWRILSVRLQSPLFASKILRIVRLVPLNLRLLRALGLGWPTTQCIVDANEAERTTCLSCLIFDRDYGHDWLAAVQRLATSQHLVLVAQTDSSDSIGASSICLSLGRWWPCFFRSSISDFSQPRWFSCCCLPCL